MRRRQWFEIHDQPWFPKSLRNLTTETLQFIWNLFGFYEPVVPHLRYALREANTRRILDLCSGGGGPWLSLVQRFGDEDGFPVEVRLTDRFPNPEALKRSKNLRGARIVFHAAPVDATRVPDDLEGFRTLFTCFHHFPPGEARAILQDAVQQRGGVGIFEVSKRNWLTIVLVLFMPLMAFALGPFIPPFRWSRLLWTYLIPIIPFVVWFDGIVSCLRAYTATELRALTYGLSADEYRWEAGEITGGPMPVTVTYLMGYPLRRQDHRALQHPVEGNPLM